MPASGLIVMQANDLVSRRCASSCRSTELHKDHIVVADLQMFTVRHLETNLNMNECHDTIVQSSSPVDGKMTFV